MGLSRNMFEGPVPSDLLCSLCGQVLLQPELSVACQHAFCSTCLQQNVSTPCPSCGTELECVPRRPAPAHTRLRLLELRIHCDHKCGQVMALGQLPQHVSHVCPNTPVECEFSSAGCRKKVRRCDLSEHAQECDFRPVSCEACGYQTLFRDLHVHQSRKRCVEMRIKNQLIKAVRSTRKEVKRHQNYLQRQQVRSDQYQRRLEVEHTKRLNTARRQRQMQKNYNMVPEDNSDYLIGPETSNDISAANTFDHNHTMDTSDHSSINPCTIPTISFMSLKDHTANHLSAITKREVVGNKISELSRINMSKEIGNLASPRGLCSREKASEHASLRPIGSRERPSHNLNTISQIDRIATSRERYDQSVARLTASRERPSHNLNTISQTDRIATSRERYDQSVARRTASREKLAQIEGTHHQQPQELFLTSAAEIDDTIASNISWSDLEVHNCRNCKRPFREGRNKANSCRWHAGPIIELFGGTCYSCGRLDYQRGCMMGRHEL